MPFKNQIACPDCGWVSTSAASRTGSRARGGAILQSHRGSKKCIAMTARKVGRDARAREVPSTLEWVLRPAGVACVLGLTADSEDDPRECAWVPAWVHTVLNMATGPLGGGLWQLNHAQLHDRVEQRLTFIRRGLREPDLLEALAAVLKLGKADAAIQFIKDHSC